MRHFLNALVGCILVLSLCHAQTTVPPQTVSRPKGAADVTQERVAFTEKPEIEMFDVSPRQLHRRVDLVFKWRIRPPRTNNPITEVKVSVGAIPLHSATALSGTYTLAAGTSLYDTILPAAFQGRMNFVLSAKNAKGATSLHPYEIEVFSNIPVIRSFSSIPVSPIRIGERISIAWGIENSRDTVPLTSVVVEEMAEDGGGRHRLYSGTDATGNVSIETRASTLPGVLRVRIEATNEARLKAEKEIRLTLMRPEDIREKPDMILEVKKCEWVLSGRTPSLRIEYEVRNLGSFRTGTFSIRLMAWRGSGAYLFEDTLFCPDIAVGGVHAGWLNLSAEQLRGATEIYFGVDDRNRVAEANERNNGVRIPVPPLR